MIQQQLNIMSGFPLQAVVLDTSSKYKEGRVPQIGFKVEFDDGRIYRMCSTREVFVASEVVGQAVAASAEFAGKLTAASAGDTELILDITGIAVLGQSSAVMAVNKMQGGHIMITDDAGEGYSYRIKSNTIQDANAKVTFTLYDAVKVAVTTDSDCCLVGNKFAEVVEAATTAETPIGGAMVPTTGASSTVLAYFWAQTKGPGIALGAGTLAAPLKLSTGGAVADSAEAGSGVYDEICGQALATTANGSVPIDWSLE
jgi:hypothetical protein